MKQLLIVGAGSFSTEVDELARINGYTDIAFLDDDAMTARSLPVVGALSDVVRMNKWYSDAIVAFGNNEMRMKYHLLLKEYGFSIPVLIHPLAYVSPDSEINSGSIVRANAVVSRYVKIGEACILNVGALVDHDCILEDGCHVLMGAVVRNKVHVPANTWIKSSAVYE